MQAIQNLYIGCFGISDKFCCCLFFYNGMLHCSWTHNMGQWYLCLNDWVDVHYHKELWETGFTHVSMTSAGNYPWHESTMYTVLANYMTDSPFDCVVPKTLTSCLHSCPFSPLTQTLLVGRIVFVRPDFFCSAISGRSGITTLMRCIEILFVLFDFIKSVNFFAYFQKVALVIWVVIDMLNMK